MNPSPFLYGLGGPRKTRITNPEMLKKIDTAVSKVCVNCSTVRTCLMCRERYIVEARPLLECSVIKSKGYGS
jgi:hypothetical protein